MDMQARRPLASSGGGSDGEESMKAGLKRAAIATSTVACVALLSFSWSEHRGVPGQIALGRNYAGADFGLESEAQHRSSLWYTARSPTSETPAA